MKKKILSSLLLGALLVSSTSVFVSCKDYDDDISSLQKQITDNASVIATLQTAQQGGVVITNVEKSADGKSLTLFTSDGNKHTITATDGQDAVVWTIGADGYWYQDGNKTDYKATGTDGKDGKDGVNGQDGAPGKDGVNGKDGAPGKDGKDGVDGKDADIWTPGTDGFWYKNGVKTEQSWAAESSGVTAIVGERAVTIKNGDNQDIVVIPTVTLLKSLVFIPESYYWGVEATNITTLNIMKYSDLMQLFSYIKSDSEEVYGNQNADKTINSNEIAIGTKYMPEEFAKLTDHTRYPVAKGDPIMVSATANYHINPAYADFTDAKVEVIDREKNYTRSDERSKALVSLDDFKGWEVSETKDTLKVPLQVKHPELLRKVTGADGDGVTTFATQVTYKDQAIGKEVTVTSDYACIISVEADSLRLAHAKYKEAGVTDRNMIQTGMLNKHCGDCTLPEHSALVTSTGKVESKITAYQHKGMHLFATLSEAKYYVEHTPRIDNTSSDNKLGEGQDLVNWNENLDLNNLVEVHYTNEKGEHAVFSQEDFAKNKFKYVFTLTPFIIGETKTNESSHAVIMLDETTNHYVLHPTTPEEGKTTGIDPATLKGIDDWTHTNKTVIGRVPLVRVELQSGKGEVLDYGYIPVRITEREVVPPPVYSITFDEYAAKAGESWSVTRYNNCMFTGGSEKKIRTTWEDTERNLMSHVELVKVNEGHSMKRELFDVTYIPETYVDTEEGKVCKQYIPTVGKENESKSQEGKWYHYEATNDGDSKKDNDAYGYISWVKEIDADGHKTSVFEWKLTANDIKALADAGFSGKTVRRAVKLASQNSNYPDMYVIFESGVIGITDKTVKADAGIKDKMIAQYWYDGVAYPFKEGLVEMHVNTVTPEENKYYATNKEDGVFKLWKPVEFKNRFPGNFWGNFEGTAAPTVWLKDSLKVYSADGKLLNEAVPAEFKYDQYDYNFEFVVSAAHKNNTAKGYLSSANATTFTLVTGNTAEGDNRALLAYVTPTRKDTVSVIRGAIGKDMTIELKKTEYAEALLNYKPHYLVDEADVLKGTVALIPKSKATYSGKKCTVEITNNTFDVRFLRPISLLDTDEAEIVDAHAKGYYAQTIRLDSLIRNYTDWRTSMQQDENGAWSVKGEKNWKPLETTGDDYDKEYFEYYSPAGTNKMDYVITGLDWTASGNDAEYASSNPNVKTDLGLPVADRDQPEKAIPLSRVASELDFKTTGVKYQLEYRNNSATVGKFHVWFPVAVKYYWGTMYTDVKVTINRTKGSEARRK